MIKKGFTLVEMLLVTGILGILLVVFTQVLSSIFSLRYRSDTTSTLTQDMRSLYSKLSSDISNATLISSPTVGVSSNTLVITRSGQTITYALDSGNLTKQVGAATPIPINSPAHTQVSAFSVTRGNPLGDLSNLVLSITLTSRYLVPGNPPQTLDLNTTIGTKL